MGRKDGRKDRGLEGERKRGETNPFKDCFHYKMSLISYSMDLQSSSHVFLFGNAVMFKVISRSELTAGIDRRCKIVTSSTLFQFEQAQILFDLYWGL